MTVLFLVAQGIYLSRHLHDADTHYAKNRGLTCSTQSLPPTSPTRWKNAWPCALRTSNACKRCKAEGRIVLAGPHPAVDSNDPGAAGFTGSLIVAEFDSLSAAQAWAEADPYIAAGVYADVVIKPFKQVLP